MYMYALILQYIVQYLTFLHGELYEKNKSGAVLAVQADKMPLSCPVGIMHCGAQE